MNGSRHGGVGAGSLQSLRNIHRNKKFVFDHEDRAPSQCWVFHAAPMRGWAQMPEAGGLFDMGRSVPSRRSILRRATSVMIDWLKAMPA
jgi:hypothetical protein